MTRTSFIALTAALPLTLGGVHANIFNPLQGWNEGAANDYGNGNMTYDQVINYISSGNPSPWLDAISVSEGSASASLDPSITNSATGAVYELGVVGLATDNGRVRARSLVRFTVDQETTYSFGGRLTGTGDGNAGEARIAGHLKGSGLPYSEYEYEFETSVAGPYDWSVGDGIVETAGGTALGDGTGTLYPGITYELQMHLTLFDGSASGSGYTGDGFFALTIGDGGGSHVPSGGSTVVLLGLGILGLGALARKPSARAPREVAR